MAGGALLGLFLLVIGLAVSNRMIASERNQKAKALVEKDGALKEKEEALKFADKIIVMDKGRILQQGSTWDVYYNPRSSRLAGLLGAVGRTGHPGQGDLRRARQHRG